MCFSSTRLTSVAHRSSVTYSNERPIHRLMFRLSFLCSTATCSSSFSNTFVREIYRAPITAMSSISRYVVGSTRSRPSCDSPSFKTSSGPSSKTWMSKARNMMISFAVKRSSMTLGVQTPAFRKRPRLSPSDVLRRESLCQFLSCSA